MRYLLLCCCLLLAGCRGNREAALVGTWKPQFSAPSPNPLAQGATLELRADHTYTMFVASFPISGQWRVDGSTLTFIDHVQPGKVSQNDNLTIGADNRTLVPRTATGDGFRWVKQ